MGARELVAAALDLDPTQVFAWRIVAVTKDGHKHSVGSRPRGACGHAQYMAPRSASAHAFRAAVLASRASGWVGGPRTRQSSITMEWSMSNTTTYFISICAVSYTMNSLYLREERQARCGWGNRGGAGRRGQRGGGGGWRT